MGSICVKPTEISIMDNMNSKYDDKEKDIDNTSKNSYECEVLTSESETSISSTLSEKHKPGNKLQQNNEEMATKAESLNDCSSTTTGTNKIKLSRPTTSIPVPKTKTNTSEMLRRIEQFKLQTEMRRKAREEDRVRQKENLEEILKRRKQNHSTEKNIISKRIKSANSQSKVSLVDSAEEFPDVPSTKKEDVYKKEDISIFKQLEEYALLKRLLKSDDMTFEQLMKELLIDQMTDVEKARILFHWTSAQNLNIIDFPKNISEDTPLGYLYDIKMEKKRYAALYMRLCQAAQLPAKEVTGYLKGVGYLPEYEFQNKEIDVFRGSWNAVRINNEWRLVDTHWGARHVIETDDVLQDFEIKTVYKYEDHYFLTNPEDLISTHFPDEPCWQLLSKPKSLEQFQKIPKQWPLFYKLGLKLISHKEGIIDTDKRGRVQIQIEMPSDMRVDSRIKAELGFIDKMKRKQNDILCSSLFHNTVETIELINVFLPETGSYLLRIFGRSKRFSEDEDTLTSVCLFQINWFETSKSDTLKLSRFNPPFPKSSSYFGLLVDSYEIGIRKWEPNNAIVECDSNGEVEIRILVENHPYIEFSHELETYDGLVLNSRCLQFSKIIRWNPTKEDLLSLTCTVRVPRNGNYLFTLFENRTKESDSLKAFLSFLIISQNIGAGDIAPFPSLNSGPTNKLGFRSTSNFFISLKQVYPKQINKTGIYYSDDQGEVVLVFNHSEELKVVTEIDNSKMSCILSVLNHQTIVAIRANTIGEYFFKMFASSVKGENNLPLVFTCLIKTIQLTGVYQPYPKSSTNWGLQVNSSINEKVTLCSSKNCVSFINSRFNLQLDEKQPVLLYNGGKDIEFKFSSNQSLAYQATLKQLNTDDEVNQFSFVSNASLNECHVIVRIPKVDSYHLNLFISEKFEDRPSIVFSILIYATKISFNVRPFPISFPLWHISPHQLASSLQKDLYSLKDNKIKLFLGQYLQIVDQIIVEPYYKVILAVDKRHLVLPTKCKDCLYEWNYFPAAVEKEASIFVQKDKNSGSVELLRYLIL